MSTSHGTFLHAPSSSLRAGCMSNIPANSLSDTSDAGTRSLSRTTRRNWSGLSKPLSEKCVPECRRSHESRQDLPLVSREWKNGNSSYNCTPFLHSLLTKGKKTKTNNITNFSSRRGLSFPHRVSATILRRRTQEPLICKRGLFMLCAGRARSAT